MSTCGSALVWIIRPLMGVFICSILSFQQNIIVSSIFQDKDVTEGNVLSNVSPDNPNAFVFTTIDWYKDYTPDKAYTNEDNSFFWGKYPQKGQEFFLVFEKPWRLERIIIETGQRDKNEDLLYSGVLEASPNVVGELPDTNSGRCNCTDYVKLGEFNGGQLDLTNLKDNVTFPIKCLRIRLTENQDEWLIIYRIAIFVMKNNDSKSGSNSLPLKPLIDSVKEKSESGTIEPVGRNMSASIESNYHK